MDPLDTRYAAVSATVSPAVRTRVNYRYWLWLVATWDGVLPLLLWVSPAIIGWLWPNHDALIALSAVFVPIAAFFARVFAGSWHIYGNFCSPAFRQFQFVTFVFGILLMLFLDALILSVHGIIPVGEQLQLVIGLSPLFGIYVLFMLLAMYPGREPIPAGELPGTERIGNWEVRR